MTTPKSIDELIGLPDVEALSAFFRDSFATSEMTRATQRYAAVKLADWLQQNDTRRALIEAMLPVFVAALKMECICINCGQAEEVQEAATRARESLNAETLKVLGVL
jgi:uncharacterized protein YerC